MMYEIHIGEHTVVDEGGMLVKHPKQVMIIDEPQRQVLECFAHTRKDKDLNTTYILNECEFRILPHIRVRDEKANTP